MIEQPQYLEDDNQGIQDPKKRETLGTIATHIAAGLLGVVAGGTGAYLAGQKDNLQKPVLLTEIPQDGVQISHEELQNILDEIRACSASGDISGLNGRLDNLQDKLDMNTAQIKGQLETLIAKPEITPQPTATEVVMLPEEEAGETALSLFEDGFGLLLGRNSQGKVVFVDEETGQVFHIDKIDRQECLEGYPVEKVIIELKAGEECVIGPQNTSTQTATREDNNPPSFTDTSTLGARNTNTPTTPAFTRTPTPSHTPTLPGSHTPTDVPTNTHAPIDTATEGPAPTLESTRTPVPDSFWKYIWYLFTK